MTETQQLLTKIATLRQRLDQAQGLAHETGRAVVHLLSNDGATVVDLRRQVEDGSAHDQALDVVLKPLEVAGDAGFRLPRQMTARARMLVERGRDLLLRLRDLNEVLAVDQPGRAIETRRGADPRLSLYRQTVALATTALRALAFLPDTATAQLPLCEGPAAILDVVLARLRTLEATVEVERAEQTRVNTLAHLLTELEQGRITTLEPFVVLASELVGQAEECLPLRLLPEESEDLSRFVATHALNVAAVVARVARHVVALRHRAIEPVIAALVMDVGLLRLGRAEEGSEALGLRELLAASGHHDAETNLTDDQRQRIELHTREGEEILRGLQPDSTWLAQAALQHHERLDGTGYPDGVKAPQLDPVARLLAVCDAYVSLAGSTAPGRGEQRTAMADTLLLADGGLLDREYAEALLQLSFYPVGTIVELADGAIGVVAAVPLRVGDLGNPSRPVVLLLLEPNGTPLPIPRHLDLSQSPGHSIVRSLPAPERKRRLGLHFPEWA